MIEKINMTMLTDFYELTMANGYFEADMKDDIAYFDMFFRKIPDDGGYAIMAGLEQVIKYMDNLEFNEEDIEYLRGKKIFSERFLEYLADFKFACDVWAIPEGTPVFPYEPLITVRGPVMQAQFVETMILLLVNHQSLIATKASRIVRAADGRPIMEFVPEDHTARRQLFMARALPTSADVPAQPAPSRMRTSRPRPWALWRTAGSRCSTTNTKRSRPTRRSTRPTRHCWSTPTMF